MKNNKNALRFIAVFAISYIILTVLYQALLVLFEPKADFFTTLVSEAMVFVFDNAKIKALENTPGYLFLINNQPVVNIKEGCNGMAVFNTLVAFCLAFRGKSNVYVWFLPLSFLLIQFANILRLHILINIKQSSPEHFDFFHIYVFPAIIYLIAFLLMVWWVKKYSGSYAK